MSSGRTGQQNSRGPAEAPGGPQIRTAFCSPVSRGIYAGVEMLSCLAALSQYFSATSFLFIKVSAFVVVVVF